MVHPKPPTPVATDSTAANITMNGTSKQKIQSNRHEILFGAQQNKTKSFLHILVERNEKLADYFTKYHRIWNHRTM